CATMSKCVLKLPYTAEPLQMDQSQLPQEEKTGRPGGSQRRYNCSVCKRVYVTLSSLKRHENVHSWQRAYPCHYCNKVFALAEYQNLVHDQVLRTKTETYIAKPACPGPSVDGDAMPLCQITVKIG
uniref:Zinc finger and BTB domain containing 38 n=1 Tax=Mastacembelus armatus TaxID=205130 RepID=A0A7N8XNB1_9TELE